MRKRSVPTKNIKIPKEFKGYFWDVDFKKLSAKRYPHFVLERIMKYGNMKAVRWMLANFSLAEMKDYVLSSGDRGLDRRSNNYWRLALDLPPSKKPVNPLWPF